MSESALYGQILAALSHGDTRLFRQQSGLAWTGQLIERTATRVVLANPRALKIGVPGISDIGGVTSVIITPEMVGRRIGIDVQIEVKAPRRYATQEQAAYIQQMLFLGGRAGVARNVDEAREIVEGKV